MGTRKSFALRAQARDSGRRTIAPGRRRADRERRVPDHGEHRRRVGGDVEMASQGRAARGVARLDAGGKLLLSIVSAKKLGSSEYGQVVHRADGDPRRPSGAGEERYAQLLSSGWNTDVEIRQSQQAQAARSTRAQRSVSKGRYQSGRRADENLIKVGRIPTRPYG